MKKSFESFIATRYLRSKRREVFVSVITVISVLGVALSVMVLNIVLAIMSGFEGELRNKLVGANAHIVIRQYGQAIEDVNSILPKLATIPEIIAAFPYSSEQAMLTSRAGTRGLIVRGVQNSPAAKEKLVEYFSKASKQTTEERIREMVDQLFKRKTLTIIRPDGAEDKINFDSILVGRELARRLALRGDEPITLFSPELKPGPTGLSPRQRRFAVAGQYQTGLVEYEGGVIYMALETAQSFFSLGTSVTGIEVELRDLMQVKKVAEKIQSELDKIGGFYYMSDWMEQNRPLWEALQLEKKVYFIVLLLLILLASFSIVSTLVMVVMEKGRDIAILKSLGASNRSVMNIFLLQGAFIGLSGTLFGTLLGYSGCLGLREYGFAIDVNVFSLDTVPVYIQAENFIIVAIAAFIITSLAGLYPALRASRIEPAVALRFE